MSSYAPMSTYGLHPGKHAEARNGQARHGAVRKASLHSLLRQHEVTAVFSSSVLSRAANNPLPAIQVKYEDWQVFYCFLARRTLRIIRFSTFRLNLRSRPQVQSHSNCEFHALYRHMHVRISPIHKALRCYLAFNSLPSVYSLNSLSSTASVVLDHLLRPTFGLTTSLSLLFRKKVCQID